MIDIQVELFPKTKQALSNEVITAQIQLERGRHAEQERLFLVYAKQWWKEYLSIREIHKERLVKIFAQVSLSVLQIRKGNNDNLGIIFLSLAQIHTS